MRSWVAARGTLLPCARVLSSLQLLQLLGGTGYSPLDAEVLLHLPIELAAAEGSAILLPLIGMFAWSSPPRRFSA